MSQHLFFLAPKARAEGQGSTVHFQLSRAGSEFPGTCLPLADCSEADADIFPLSHPSKGQFPVL